MSFKKIVIPVILAAFLILAVIFKEGRHQTLATKVSSPSSTPLSSQATVVSTSPSPLEGATITPTQTVSITFSDPVWNKDELKSQIDPKIDYTITLTNNNRTVEVTPNKPYGFNQQYTFSISKDTKFDDGKKTLDKDYSFGYRTVSYSGV